MSTIYDAPGITYDGIPTNDSLLGAVNKIGQVWLHMNLDTLSPGGFTKEGIASAVVSDLQATTIPVNATQGAWPTATENADAVWSKTLP